MTSKDKQLFYSQCPMPHTQCPFGFAVAHGGNHAICSTWGDPKTAMAPQDRAVSPIPILR